MTAPQRNGGPRAIRAIAAALRLLALAIGLLLPSAAGTMAQDPARRVALFVGNAQYKDAAPLATPINDVEDLAAAVTGLGFDVTVLKNATAAELRQALQSFADKSAKAALSVVYFGGHSVEFAGENYLVPVDAVFTAESSIRREAIPLRAVTLTVAKAQVLGLIILDALRPNTFLAKIERDGVRDAPGEAGSADGFRNVLQFFAAETGRASCRERVYGLV